MTTTPPTPPSVRFACRLVRLRSALAGPGPAVARHVAGCAECRAHFAAGAALDARLRQGARAAIASPPATAASAAGTVPPADRAAVGSAAPRTGFESDLLRAVRQARAEAAVAAPPARRSPWVRAGLWSAGVACAVFAIAVLVGYGTGRRSTAVLAAESAAMADVVRAASTRLVDTVIPVAGTAVADNPLQHELGAVAADVRSALDFLAMNFLPHSG